MKNQRIKEYLQLIINKPFDKITDDDLNKIKSIVIDSQSLSQEDSENDIINLLPRLKALENVNFINTLITANELELLKEKSILNIYLENCAIENEKQIVFPENLKSLEMRKCFFDNYDYLLDKLPTSLKYLAIGFPRDESQITGKKLNKLIMLEKIILDGCIVDFEGIDYQKCKHLQLLNTDVKKEDIEQISKSGELKRLYISKQILSGLELDKSKIKYEIKTKLNEFVFDNVDDEKIKR